MKREHLFEVVIAAIFSLALFVSSSAAAGSSADSDESDGTAAQMTDSSSADNEADLKQENQDGAPDSGDATRDKKMGAKAKPAASRTKKRIFSGEEAFIAGPDWEFDGFVVGGQDQEVKSMYVVNDLVYLNVGVSHGFKPGDRMGIYKRGGRVRDPHSSRFLGYEVRRVATVEITNKIEDETCSVKVINASTGIEIGDLVRRDR